MSDHARMGDPTSSDVAVKAIVNNRGLQENVLLAAQSLHPALFDDTDLMMWVELHTQRRQQRNVIARARGRLERDGELVRYPVLVDRIDPVRKTVHFRLPRIEDTYPDPLDTESGPQGEDL